MLCSILCMGHNGNRLLSNVSNMTKKLELLHSYSCWHLENIKYCVSYLVFGRSCSMVINYNYWDRIWSFVLLPSGLLLVCSLSISYSLFRSEWMCCVWSFHSLHPFLPPTLRRVYPFRRPFCNTIKFIDWKFVCGQCIGNLDTSVRLWVLSTNHTFNVNFDSNKQTEPPRTRTSPISKI